MATFEQKPESAVQKTNKNVGEYREMLIEKHEKDADMRKVFNNYKKAVGAEIVGTTEEGLVIRFPESAAIAYDKSCKDKANRAARETGTVTVDRKFSDIAGVHSNTVENISAQELLGG